MVNVFRLRSTWCSLRYIDMYLSEGQLACGCSHVLGGGIEEPGPGRAQQLDGDASGFLLLQIDNNRTEKDVRPYIQVLENKSKSSQHL